jgi:hypothetical protein
MILPQVIQDLILQYCRDRNKTTYISWSSPTIEEFCRLSVHSLVPTRDMCFKYGCHDLPTLKLAVLAFVRINIEGSDARWALIKSLVTHSILYHDKILITPHMLPNMALFAHIFPGLQLWRIQGLGKCTVNKIGHAGELTLGRVVHQQLRSSCSCCRIDNIPYYAKDILLSLREPLRNVL